MLTGDEASDFKGHLPVMDADEPAPKMLLADKGYDADFIRGNMERRGRHRDDPDKAEPDNPIARRLLKPRPAQHGRALL